MRRLPSALSLVASAGLFALLGQACSSKSTHSTFNQPPPDFDAGTDAYVAPPSDDGGLVPADDSGPTLGDGGGTVTDAAPALLDAGCATATALAKRDPVYMLIVLDGSGSMDSDNKWAAVVPALDSIFDEILTEQDPTFGVGLTVFSDAQDLSNGNGPYPQSNDVFVNVVDKAQHDALRARIDTSSPSGGTPILAALSGNYAKLENFVPFPPLVDGGVALPKNGRKVVVLMTDGVPNGGSDEQNQSIAAATAELSKAAPLGPITTFAVGVGPFPTTDTGSYDPKFLTNLALAGGAAPAGCDPSASNINNLCYFQVTPNGKTAQQIEQDFIDAINKIRSAVTTCEYELSFQSGTVDPTRVNVTITDSKGVQTLVSQDPKDGWTYDDPNTPTKVLLHGAACNEVKNLGNGKVNIILGCKTIAK